MLKKLTLAVPKHLKKFLESPEFGAPTDSGIHVEKWSTVGRIIHSVSRPIPYTVPYAKPTGTTITISYYCREKVYDVPPDKLLEVVRLLDEIFRLTLISEVRKAHELTGGDYSQHIRTFLDRYQIERDVDIDWETIRKVYRDYLVRVERKRQKSYA